MLNSSFRQFGLFDANLAVDEMMVSYLGCTGAKQFIRGKPIRFGFKLWSLSGQSGHCFGFDLYTGKSNDQEDIETANKALGSKVVLKMIEPIQTPENHRLFIDNF